MSKGLHRFAVLLACATFFLIIAGANVTSHDAGLATSDWPLSNGQVFPKMVGNLFWEHGHRLVATGVGILTIAFNLLVWEIDIRVVGAIKRMFGGVTVKHRYHREPRPWMRWFSLSALGAVIAQGLLGGLTVKLNLPLAVSAAHATLAQLFFLITVSLAVFTSPGWLAREASIAEEGGPSIRSLGLIALIAILAQLVLGATLRHSATWDQDLPTTLLLAHVAGAVIVTLILGFTIMGVLLRYGTEQYLARPAMLAALLLLGQLGLGIAASFTRL